MKIEEYTLRTSVNNLWEIWAAIFLADETDRCDHCRRLGPEHKFLQGPFSKEIESLVYKKVGHLPHIQKLQLKGYELESCLSRKHESYIQLAWGILPAAHVDYIYIIADANKNNGEFELTQGRP